LSEDEIKIHGSLSPEDLVRLQINRCNVTSSLADRGIFNANVLALMRNLPSHKLLELKNMRGEYTDIVTIYKYKYSCGRPMGTPENPIYRNNEGDWDWDGGDPILVSPIPVDVEVVDYDKLFIEKKKKTVRTPTFEEDEDE